MCVPIRTRIYTIHTHTAHTYTCCQRCALTVVLSNSFMHLVLLSCQDLLQLHRLLCSYDTRKKCSAWLPECPGGLFVYFSLTLGEAPESKGAAAPGTSLLAPLQASCSPTTPAPFQALLPWGWEAAISMGQCEEGNTHSYSPTHSNNKITLQHKGIVSVTR